MAAALVNSQVLGGGYGKPCEIQERYRDPRAPHPNIGTNRTHHSPGVVDDTSMEMLRTALSEHVCRRHLLSGSV